MASKSNSKSRQSPTPKTLKNPSQLEAKQPTEPTNRPTRLTVVGIGASAGGLAALTSFFDTLSQDMGMAFVVVTHLHPEHESHLAELLQKHTKMPTLQVMKKVKVEPDHVYVIPPNRSILMTDTHLETVGTIGGLMRFRNRLALLGCKLDIQSLPGDGTKVVIDVPLEQVKV